MKQEELQNISTEELIKKEKQLKGIVGFFIGILIVGIAAGIYLSIVKKKFATSLVAIFGLLVFIPMNIANIKAIRKEINMREGK
jgi:hypothetical protein